MSGVATANDGTNRRGGRDTGRLRCLGTPRAHARADAEPVRLGSVHAANAVTFAVYGALGGALFLLPIELQQVSGYTALEAGISLLPVTVISRATDLDRPGRGSLRPCRYGIGGPACAWRAVRSRPSSYASFPVAGPAARPLLHCALDAPPLHPAAFPPALRVPARSTTARSGNSRSFKTERTAVGDSHEWCAAPSITMRASSTREVMWSLRNAWRRW